MTPTRTLPPTRTPTGTNTPWATPTEPCAGGLQWELSPEREIAVQQGGNAWLAKVVATDSGWGVFWTREDPGDEEWARVYYAHVDFDASVSAGPLALVDTPRIAWRGRYYNAAWNVDHYGLLVADRATLYYYNVSRDGVPSGGRVVGPQLFTSSVYDQEADSDLDSYPGGFLGVIEGSCYGHSCSYAFLLSDQGTPRGSPQNLVDFDYSHQFWPKAAYDGAGFAIISVKDMVGSGGVVTKYMQTNGAGLSDKAKVVPTKDYLWDEYPDIAWNGNHFAAIWTEVTQRPPSGEPPEAWAVRFATFRRSAAVAGPIANRRLDARLYKSPYRWTKQVHAVGNDWAAHYSVWQENAEPLAVFELLDDGAGTHAVLTPFTLSADALGSAVHWAEGHVGQIGVARADTRDGVTRITFALLDPPVCAGRE